MDRGRVMGEEGGLWEGGGGRRGPPNQTQLDISNTALCSTATSRSSLCAVHILDSRAKSILVQVKPVHFNQLSN